MCEPSVSPDRAFGELQATQAPSSSLHSNVSAPDGEWLSVPEKVKLGELSLLGFDGFVSIVVSGAVASTVNAGSVTKWVPSFSSFTFQAPWFASAMAGHGDVS